MTTTGRKNCDMNSVFSARYAQIYLFIFHFGVFYFFFCVRDSSHFHLTELICFHIRQVSTGLSGIANERQKSRKRTAAITTQRQPFEKWLGNYGTEAARDRFVCFALIYDWCVYFSFQLNERTRCTRSTPGLTYFRSPKTKIVNTNFPFKINRFLRICATCVSYLARSPFALFQLSLALARPNDWAACKM